MTPLAGSPHFHAPRGILGGTWAPLGQILGISRAIVHYPRSMTRWVVEGQISSKSGKRGQKREKIKKINSRNKKKRTSPTHCFKSDPGPTSDPLGPTLRAGAQPKCHCPKKTHPKTAKIALYRDKNGQKGSKMAKIALKSPLLHLFRRNQKSWSSPSEYKWFPPLGNTKLSHVGP